jgi:hypothetical protein
MPGLLHHGDSSPLINAAFSGMLLMQYGINEMPFQKGKSGNPAGRKPGKRNRLTEVARMLGVGVASSMRRVPGAIAPSKRT